MTVREFRVLAQARFDLSMEAWGRLGWMVWRIRSLFVKQRETHDAVMGDRWHVWRMARAAEAEKKK